MWSIYIKDIYFLRKVYCEGKNVFFPFQNIFGIIE